ncbi:hypothetical protein BH10BAC2_BH10BAC2_30500 [soil metagenome]
MNLAMVILIIAGCVAHLYDMFNIERNDAVCDATKAQYFFKSRTHKNCNGSLL